MNNLKAALTWGYAGMMAVLTAIVDGGRAAEPDKLIWMLGFTGALAGVALLPSAKLWHSGVKMVLGWLIAGVASTPVVNSHYAPAFMDAHFAALWLGFAGPAFFMASIEGHALIGRIANRGKPA